jgi:hypothetical protein
MRHLCLALVLTALPVGAAQATPFEPASIPQQVEAAGHVDVDALRTTQLFAAFGGQAAIDKSIGELPPELRPLAAPLAKAVRGISFWHADDRGALYLETRDPRALAALLAKAPVKPGVPVDGIATFTADPPARGGGGRHHGRHHDHDHGFLGAYGDTLVIADSHEALAQSLRVLAGKAPNLVGSRALASAARNGVFVFVTIGDGLLGDLSKTSSSKLMQLGAKSIVIDASEAAGVVTANARLELASADALAKAKTILDGMRALASMSDEPGVKRLIDGVAVSTNGTSLAVVARWPVADLKALIEHAHGK